MSVSREVEAPRQLVPPTTPTIALHGIERIFPGDVPVHALCPTDLVVQRGEFVAVTGPSGSGKSTLLNILGLLDRPTKGSYTLDGVPTTTLDEIDRTTVRGRRIGFVFQAFHLLPYRSALENVMLAQVYVSKDRQERYQRSMEVLRKVGLGHRMDAMPPTMSGGERQRVAVARALVNRPSLLLCDEPTGNLDTKTSAMIMDLFKQVNETGQTVLIITHDMAVAERANRTLAMRDGNLTDPDRDS